MIVVVSSLSLTVLLVAATGEQAPPEPDKFEKVYTAEHFEEVAQGLKAIRDYAQTHVLGRELGEAIAAGNQYHTAAGIQMIYTYQAFVEGGENVHQHVLSISFRGGYLPTSCAGSLGAYVTRLLPVGSNPVSVHRSERGVLYVALRMADDAHKIFMAAPLRIPEEPMDRVITQSLLEGRRLGIGPPAKE